MWYRQGVMVIISAVCKSLTMFCQFVTKFSFIPIDRFLPKLLLEDFRTNGYWCDYMP